MNELTSQFIAFTKALADNKCNYELWQKYAVAHYSDEELEAARIALVRICNDDDSIGNDIWPLTDEAIEKIKKLLVKLESNYS